MRVLFDTDILLDVALQCGEFFPESAAALQWAESNPGLAAIAWHSLSKLAYLLRPDPRPFICELLGFLEVPSTGTEAAIRAIGFPMRDFEDALQSAAALEFGASHIVTRNSTDYRRSPVPSISPAEFVRRIHHE